jgi:RimJ/RimL family protein N-acetyltransferase
MMAAPNRRMAKRTFLIIRGQVSSWPVVLSFVDAPLQYRLRMDELRNRFSWLRSRSSRPDPTPPGAPANEPEPDVVREGRLVQLRRHTVANRTAFQRWYADEEIAKLLRHDQRTLNHLQSRSYFDTIMLPASANGHAWAIHERSSGKLIGASALMDFEGSAHRFAYFRIVIGEKPFWGRGYGREATVLSVAEGFERLGLDEVKLEVFSTNERAIRAYRHVGFQQTGEHREWLGRDRFELHVIEMSIYRGEFEERQAPVDFTPANVDEPLIHGPGVEMAEDEVGRGAHAGE